MIKMLRRWWLAFRRKLLCNRGLHKYPLSSKDNSIVHFSYHTKSNAQVFERRCCVCGHRDEIIRYG